MAVLKHGLKVTVSTNTPAKASFVVAMPAPTVKQKRKHGKRVVKQKMSTIFRSGAFSFAPGSPLGIVEAFRCRLIEAARAPASPWC